MQISFQRKLAMGGEGRTVFLFSVTVDALCCILVGTQAEGDTHCKQAEMHSRCCWFPVPRQEDNVFTSQPWKFTGALRTLCLAAASVAMETDC